MRFDAPEHLEAWRARGVWPAIHNAMTAFAVAHMRGETMLDLGCSYGLLGARIASEAGGIVTHGIEVDEKVIVASQDAGVPIRLYRLKLTVDTLPEFSAILRASSTTAVVARRILPELWGGATWMAGSCSRRR